MKQFECERYRRGKWCSTLGMLRSDDNHGARAFCPDCQKKLIFEREGGKASWREVEKWPTLQS